MYHMARSPRPPCPRAEPLMPPKPGDDDRQSRNYCESRRRRRRCTIARRSSPRTRRMISFGNFFRVSRPAGNPLLQRQRASPRGRPNGGVTRVVMHIRARPAPARCPARDPRAAATSAAHRYRGRFLRPIGEPGGGRCALRLFRTRPCRPAESGGRAPGARRGGGTRAACSVAAASRQLATNGCTRRESKSAAFLTLRPRA